MKKTILLIVLIVLNFCVKAQNTLPENGNVGIGTTTPVSLLDVNGDGKIGSLDSRHYLRIASKTFPEIRFQTPSSDRQIRLGVASANYNNFGLSEGDFYTYTATTATMPLIVNKNGNVSLVNKSGNVGIGTTTPVSLLDVNGDGKIGSLDSRHYLRIASKTFPEIRFQTPSSDRQMRLGVASADYSNFGLSEGDFYAYTSTTATMPLIVNKNGNVSLVNKSGNVGIGTTLPQSKFHVVSGTSGGESKIHFQNGTTAVNGSITLALNPNNTLARGAEIQALAENPNQTALIFKTNFSGQEPIERMRIDTQGNVGIGTINPGTWKLAVNGNIRAKEIKVETGWSDFVFENDYKLPTLTEVELHIKEKGHLKDIPSAKEVATNGIFLGEMDSKLLQKIEELTLYTIQQEKTLKEQSSKNEEYQKRIQKLESLVEELLKQKN